MNQSRKAVATLLAANAMLAGMGGGGFLPNFNFHKPDHHYRDHVKTQMKGLSSEQMGTKGKKKSRAQRKAMKHKAK